MIKYGEHQMITKTTTKCAQNHVRGKNTQYTHNGYSAHYILFEKLFARIVSVLSTLINNKCMKIETAHLLIELRNIVS